MRSSLTFNGVSSEELNLFIEKVPNQNRPERKMDIYNVPGRNGDIIIMQDAWENVSQSYEIWGGWDEIGKATRVGYSLSNWLFSASGYQRLEDTYDQEHYRLAYFAGPFDFENILRRRGRATITFNCDPRRFLNVGEYPITLPRGNLTSVYNPTSHPAKPVFDINIGNICNLQAIHDDTVTMLTISSPGHYIVDVEKESITDTSGNPAFNTAWGKFPILEPGETSINFGAVSGTCTMVPNWWEL